MTTPREQLVRVMHAEVCCPCDPYGCDVAEVSENRYADAIIAAGWTPPTYTETVTNNHA